MKRSEYEAKMKALQDEIETLKKVEIEEDSGRWKPNADDKYYYIDETGSIDSYSWDNYGYDKEHYEIGNCFKTREEADFAIQKLMVLAELKEFAEPRDAEWDGAKKHYCIRYNIDRGDFVVDYNHTLRHATLYFASAEAAHEAIEKVGEERIKKYYLEVE